MIVYRQIEPFDVLYLRGNRLFGGAGQHGEAQIPPWPSVFAGAMASRILADKELITRITKNPQDANTILINAAGKDFACIFLGIARENKLFLPLPNDLVAFEDEQDSTQISLSLIRPQKVPEELSCSSVLPMLPVIETETRVKPVSGIWMDMEGWKLHLDGQLPAMGQLISSSKLWSKDSRLGIARDLTTKTAAEGKIYTSEAIALSTQTTFIAGFAGSANAIPSDGLLRLGGDGRGAAIAEANVFPDNDMGRPKSSWSGFRMILISPGIFPNGWLPPGCQSENDGYYLYVNGLKARLEAASIGRPQTISGWNLAKHEPKPARKVVPTGSVYWFKVIEGDTASLEPLWENSLYAAEANLSDELNVDRKREGFSRVWFGKWESNF